MLFYYINTHTAVAFLCFQIRRFMFSKMQFLLLACGNDILVTLATPTYKNWNTYSGMFNISSGRLKYSYIKK